MEAVLEEQAFAECLKQYIDSMPFTKKMLICEHTELVERIVKKINPTVELTVWNHADKDAFLNDENEPGEVVYDYIYAGRILEKAAYADKVAVKLRKMLGHEGHVLFLLGNIHHGDIIRQLGTNHWPGDSKVAQAVFSPYMCRFFTAQDAVKLLVDTGYENIVVDLIAQDISDTLRQNYKKVFIDLSDEDFNAVYWLIDATRYDEVGVYLRQQYTESVRMELVKILRRIENDIEVRENTGKLLALCADNQIPFEYIQSFMQHALLKPAKAMKAVARILQESSDG